MKIILVVILGYLAYQFLFKLVIPVYINSRRIKKGFQEMHRRMEEFQKQQAQTQQNNSSATPSEKKPSQPKSDDYIEFEEL